MLSVDSGFADPSTLGDIAAIRMSMRLLLVIFAAAVSSWVVTCSRRGSS
jgi:hypothetical protein